MKPKLGTRIINRIKIKKIIVLEKGSPLKLRKKSICPPLRMNTRNLSLVLKKKKPPQVVKEVDPATSEDDLTELKKVKNENSTENQSETMQKNPEQKPSVSQEVLPEQKEGSNTEIAVAQQEKSQIFGGNEKPNFTQKNTKSDIVSESASVSKEKSENHSADDTDFSKKHSKMKEDVKRLGEDEDLRKFLETYGDDIKKGKDPQYSSVYDNDFFCVSNE